MNIAIVGTGYVGLVTGTCFAEMGTNVTCVDIDTKKIDKLNNGIMPIYEPGLEELVKKNVREGRLHFTTDLTSALGKVEIVFSAVGTPPDEDGSADLHYVLDVARTFGQKINRYTLLVTKSTVPVGTAQKVKAAIREELEKRGVNIPFDVASNPEFLKEGAAIKDFMNPDRVVVGVDSQQARTLMERLYKPFLLNGFPILFMDVSSAEMTKYAANAMLATRISFMNDIANLCERIGANVDMVRKGMGADDRIGSRFLYAGCGYGGSCFPKDVKALCRNSLYGLSPPERSTDQNHPDIQHLWAQNESQRRTGRLEFHRSGASRREHHDLWRRHSNPELPVCGRPDRGDDTHDGDRRRFHRSCEYRKSGRIHNARARREGHPADRLEIRDRFQSTAKRRPKAAETRHLTRNSKTKRMET